MLFRLGIEGGAKKWLERESITKRCAQIGFGVAKETGAKPSISSKAYAIAATAVRMSHRSYKTDAARSAAKTKISSGTVAPDGSLGGLERSDRFEPPHYFFTRHYMIPGQIAKLTDRHQLDEPHMPLAIQSESGEITNLVVIDSTHDHDVDLDW